MNVEDDRGTFAAHVVVVSLTGILITLFCRFSSRGAAHVSHQACQPSSEGGSGLIIQDSKRAAYLLESTFS